MFREAGIRELSKGKVRFKEDFPHSGGPTEKKRGGKVRGKSKFQLKSTFFCARMLGEFG